MKIEISTELRTNLRQQRQSAGLTQANLAKRVGISRETVIAIEKGEVGSIKSLEINVVAAWHDACRPKVPNMLTQAYAGVIKRIFKIN